MKKIVPIIFVISVTLIGCKDQQKEKYLTQLNDLQITLDCIDSSATNINTLRIDSITQNVNKTLKKIKLNYNQDTISLSFAEKIESYKEISPALSTNSGNLAKVKMALPEIQKKIEDLQHDIDNGVNNREKYPDFVTFEKGKVEKIKKIMDYYIETNTRYCQRYDSLQPIMERFIQDLVEK